MANTWHGANSPDLPANFDVRKTEASSSAAAYEVKRVGSRFEYVTALPDGRRVELPVETIVGGQRHGLSFLMRVDRVGDIGLDRPALAEGRYAYSLAHRELVVSPGFALEKPTTYEDSLGNVLSSGFEQRCLTCHGQPNTLGAGKQGGVHCESCHGPAMEHVAAVAKGRPREGVLNPARQSTERQMEVCGQCHTGFTFQSDPLPDDLLVSNQVNALTRAECYIQSGGKVGCKSCHDPHNDSKNVAAQTVATCLGCHSAKSENHAAICPVNSTDKCVGCHMPSIQKGSFKMADHWIRVHPEQGIEAAHKQEAALRSKIAPLREFLRIIVVPDQEKANQVKKRLAAGEAFRQVATQLSADATAGAGGYLGDMDISQLDPRLAEAAAGLWYGETSTDVDLGNRRVILNRLPRDFKWEANQYFEKAAELHTKGDARGTVENARQALAVYPYFLRAMILMATTVGEAGDIQRAAQILRFAAQSYPKDAITEFNLALTLTNNPSEQIAALERTLDMDPDMLAAYESLGAALYSTGKQEEALAIFRKGLLVDPLAAKLNYDLGLALIDRGDKEEGQKRMALAMIADPQIVSKK